MTTITTDPLIYTERTDDDAFEPTQEDIEEYAKRIGIDASSEPELLYLAREGLRAPLPDCWKPCRQKTKDRDVWFYYNLKTRASQWEHPMDSVYRERVLQARSELAMNKIQSFDPLTMRPPKSLPPLKKSGASFAPINPAVSSLGKLGGFGPAAGDLRQTANSNPTLSNNFQNSSSSNTVGRLQNNNLKIISGSTLNSFKDTTDDDEEDSIRFMRPPRKSGLTLTGGGAKFLKGSDGFTKSKGGSLDYSDGTHESDIGGAGDSDQKPIKSILVNSVTRSRPTNPSDNIYELDGFSMNLDEMTDEEKMVLSQLESTATSRSKGNVKFNLDENTELKFEMSGDENEENSPHQNLHQNEDETGEESENSESSSRGAIRNQEKASLGNGDNNGSKDNSMYSTDDSKITSNKALSKNEVVCIPEYSEEEISAMKKAMRDEMEAELNIFKEQLEEERKSRQEQIQKHLEESVTQFKLEKEDTIKRIRKELENERNFEVDKAKREIDSLLQTELEEMRIKFDNALQARQKELEDEHNIKLDTLKAEFRKKEEVKLSDALKQQVSEEVLKAAEIELKNQKESLRDEHKRQLSQMKDYHKTVIEKLQADLLAEEEKLRQDHILKQAEILTKFEQDTEELKNRLIQDQKETLEKIQADFNLKKTALEESLTASLQEIRDNLYQNKRSVSETNISDKTADDELRLMKVKYQQLENKYKAMKQELHQLSQEMSARRLSIGNSSVDHKPSIRDTRQSQKGNSKLAQLNESYDVSDTNHDSAHGSDSNTESNSSLYPSSDGVRQIVGDRMTSSVLNTKQDSSSQANRINAALQALEILKQEILDLKENNSNKQNDQEPSPQTVGGSRTTVQNKSSASTNSKVSSARRPSKYDVSNPLETHSTRKKIPSGATASSKSARVKVSSPSPPTHDTSTDITHPPKLVSRSVSVNPQDLSGPHSEPISEDTHQKIVEDAKAFIRMQKNRLKDPSPIQNSSHLILPTTKNNLLLFDEKLLKSVSPRRPASIHLDLVSETESSGVSSLKDHRSSESKKLSKDIDEICNSLISLDQQMKLMWSVVKDKQQQPYYHQDESPFLNTNSSSNLAALLPNTMPIILGKSTRVSASLPTSARKPLVPPTTMLTPTNMVVPSGSIHTRNYSSLLSNSQNTSSQTVIDALRMSGLSTTRLDCVDLLKSLEDELKEFKPTTKNSTLLDSKETHLVSDDKQISSPRHKNNSNILAKTKDLQEWIKKY